MKAKLLIVIILFSIFSCSNNRTEKFFDSKDVSYIIDLDGNKEESIPYSYIFKNVRTIILETQRDCMIGGISELQVFDGCIYLLDNFVANGLFVFDMEGRFIRKNYYNVVYHKKTGIVKIAKKLSNDLILKQNDDTNFMSSFFSGNFKFSDLHGAYECVSPMIMDMFLKAVKNKEFVPDLDKIDQLQELNVESNPVIFYYEFKDAE